mgnify:CR=1 FL=1
MVGLELELDDDEVDAVVDAAAAAADTKSVSLDAAAVRADDSAIDDEELDDEALDDGDEPVCCGISMASMCGVMSMTIRSSSGLLLLSNPP